jgi:16S rRNA C967 or C1407 C5-methylase (RsmB/RsmF family)
MKLYDADGNEVEAFTQKEVDAKIAETTKLAEESKKALETLTAEHEKLTKLHTDKSNSYTELLKKNKEYEEAERTRSEDIEKTYSKSIEEKVKEIAGEDKEYAKALKEQLEREGIKEITNDTAKIEKQIKEAKVLTDLSLSREPNANPIDGGGSAPDTSNPGTKFTDTAAGKSTFEALAGMAGIPLEESK